MTHASTYVLILPEERREILLDRYDEYPSATVAEPVPRFSHSKRAPLVVLASFEDDKITHIADGRKGASAGTDLVRLNLKNLQPLHQPLTFEELAGLVPARFRAPLIRVLEGGGLLPPKTLGALVDALIARDPSLAPRLTHFS